MVRHWIKLLRTKPDNARSIRASLAINVTGAIFTGVVLIVVTITKFTHGAYIVFLVMPNSLHAHDWREPLLPRRLQRD